MEMGSGMRSPHQPVSGLYRLLLIGCWSEPIILGGLPAKTALARATLRFTIVGEPGSTGRKVLQPCNAGSSTVRRMVFLRTVGRSTRSLRLRAILGRLRRPFFILGRGIT
jgi:hypothetical protein